MFKYLMVDPEKNMLLCSTDLVGIGEIVEIHSLGEGSGTPPQITGKILRKVADPNCFQVQVAYDSHEYVGKKYPADPRCIFRILIRTVGGTRRRKFAKDEKVIVNMEKGENFKEKKVTKAKTGSVRKKR
jgi:hypothetical protein